MYRALYSSDTLPTRPQIYAHRGSTVLAPENTALAFDLALRHRADVLETDVRLSRDGLVMVTHDELLDRTTSGRGRVRDHLARKIANLDAGYHFTDLDGRHWRGDGARIETLADLFQRYPDIHINIDIKDSQNIAAAAVAAGIEQAGREQSVTVGSFHATTLAHFRRCAPGVRTAACQPEVARLYFRLPSRGGAPLQFQYLQIPVSWCGLPLARPGFIARAQRQGVQAVYWTINDIATMQHLNAAGADGIVTDRPDLAAQAFT